MGQVHAQGERAEMINALKETNGEYYCNVNSAWQSDDSLSTKDYKKILEQSIFTPCPRGNSSVDTFRLYEAIEAGSIPVVVKDDYWSDLLGENHPFIQVSNWKKAAADIEYLSKQVNWQEDYSSKLRDWWKEYKSNITVKIKNIIDEPNKPNNNLKTKQQQFIQLKDQWQNFKDYDIFKYLCCEMKEVDSSDEKFSVYNSGKKIAIVSLYTPEIADYAQYSERSIKDYCEKQGYTFYVYREKLDANAHANWSKARAILNHFDDHEDIIWMDSDTVIFNPEKRFEDILSKCSSTKKIIACEDIGNNSMLNSGIVIFRNHNYTKNIIKKWMNFNGNKSSLYASGGDQEILCDVLKKSDGFGFNRKIFKMNEFNTDPRLLNEDTFILHFMAYPFELKKIFIRYFVSS
jgi:hypothetical protein